MNLDEIGPWSEIKLDILRDYATPYSTILKNNGFRHGYGRWQMLESRSRTRALALKQPLRAQARPIP
jgi:hypothetical protein